MPGNGQAMSPAFHPAGKVHCSVVGSPESPTAEVALPSPDLAARAFSRALTAADYARAERLMGYNTTALVSGGAVSPTWLPDDRFWYRVTTEKGPEFVLVDPARRTRGACTLPECKDAPARATPGAPRA